MFGGREAYIPEYIVVRGNLGERAVLFLHGTGESGLVLG